MFSGGKKKVQLSLVVRKLHVLSSLNVATGYKATNTAGPRFSFCFVAHGQFLWELCFPFVTIFFGKASRGVPTRAILVGTFSSKEQSDNNCHRFPYR